MSETICAISTALGEGAIGIVRLSGDEAFSIADKIVRLPKGKTVESLPTHTINYGNVIDPATNEKIEEITKIKYEKMRRLQMIVEVLLFVVFFVWRING